MQSAKMPNDLDPRANEKMVGVAEDDLRAERMQFLGRHRFDGPLCADRHENRRLDDTVRCRQSASPCFGRRVIGEKLKH